jgi:hypothetical protein
MMYAMFAATEKTVQEIQFQINLELQVNSLSPKLTSVIGESHKVMQLIGRFADNGDDCLIKAEIT